MPNRIIKESICRSDNLNKLTPSEECFFYRLLVQCDDYGRYDGRPAILKGSCFPLKDRINKRVIEGWLAALEAVKLIQRYEVNGLPYIQLPTWNDHQQVRAKRSKYPSMESNGSHPLSTDITCPRNPIQSKSKSESNPTPQAVSFSYSEDFEKFWAIWISMGRAQNKLGAYDNWNTCLKGRNGKKPHVPATTAQLLTAGEHYRDKCIAAGTPPEFIMLAKTFLGPDQLWKDHLEVEKDFADKILEEAKRDEG